MNNSISDYRDDLGAIAEIHRERLFRLAHRITRDRETAKDALQEALLSAMEHRDSFLGLSSLKTYLYRLIINKCIDANRRQSRWRKLLSILRKEDLYPEANHDLFHEQQVARMRDIVRILPERLKIPLVLVEYEKLSYGEISDILEISLNTVKMRVFKAREKLRKMVRKEGVLT